MKPVVALLFPLLPLTGSLAAQDPSKWCLYEHRPPDSIIARHRESVVESDLVVSGNQFPSRLAFRFTGQVRPIESDRRDFLRKYFLFLQREGADTAFRHEVEMRPEPTMSYWFPIQEVMLEDFRTEVAPGDSTSLFLLWAGAYGPKHESKDWVFLINEFTSGRSSKFWIDELATCSR